MKGETAPLSLAGCVQPTGAVPIPLTTAYCCLGRSCIATFADSLLLCRVRLQALVSASPAKREEEAAALEAEELEQAIADEEREQALLEENLDEFGMALGQAKVFCTTHDDHTLLSAPIYALLKRD